MIARFKGGAEMDYLVQAMDEVGSMAEAMERIRACRGSITSSNSIHLSRVLWALGLDGPNP